MSETEKVAIVVGAALFFFVAGLATGYAIYITRYRVELADYQDQLIEDQRRIASIEEHNRDLRDRQRAALGIVDRTADNLAAASGGIDSIEGYVDAILAAVDGLESAYRALDPVE